MDDDDLFKSARFFMSSECSHRIEFSEYLGFGLLSDTLNPFFELFVVFKREKRRYDKERERDYTFSTNERSTTSFFISSVDF